MDLVLKHEEWTLEFGPGTGRRWRLKEFHYTTNETTLRRRYDTFAPRREPLWPLERHKDEENQEVDLLLPIVQKSESRNGRMLMRQFKQRDANCIYSH